MERGVGLGDLGSGEGGDFSPQVLYCFIVRSNEIL